MITGQVPVTTTAALVVTLDDRRDLVALTASANLYIGSSSSVTADTGHLVVANVPFYCYPGNPEFNSAEGSIYAIVESGTATLTFAVMANQEKS